jgi:hypothetical protein
MNSGHVSDVIFDMLEGTDAVMASMLPMEIQMGDRFTVHDFE